MDDAVYKRNRTVEEEYNVDIDYHSTGGVSREVGETFLQSILAGDGSFDLALTHYYGYNVAVIDLRNPTKSDGNNLLHLVNKYMDLWKANRDNLSYKAKAEKYAKIISKTIILSGMDGAAFGQNAFFYDAAEGLLTASILLVAEFCPPETRHIVSVFKIIQDLLAPSGIRGKTIMDPRNHSTPLQLIVNVV